MKKLIWVITNGKAGNIIQAKALANYLPCEVKFFNLPIPNWQRLFTMKFISKHFTSLKSLPSSLPSLVIGCGRHSIPYLLAIKKSYGHKVSTIYIHDPRISASNFDFVVAKTMDRIKGTNVIHTLGSLHSLCPNQINSCSLKLIKHLPPHSGPFIFIAIGGGSRTSRYLFTQKRCKRLIKKIISIANSFEGTILISPTRRTGQKNIQQLKSSLENKQNIYFDDKLDIDTYYGMLGLADYCLVSSDSVNLLTESCFTQKPVYYYHLPGFITSIKLYRFIRSMKDALYIRKYNGCFHYWQPPLLNEAKRASKKLIHSLKL